jgi:hypothetical protein
LLIGRPSARCVFDRSLKSFLEIRAMVPEVVHFLGVLLGKIEHILLVQQRSFYVFLSGFARLCEGHEIFS